MRCLNAIEAEVPAGKMVHVILDNYAAHRHPTAGPSNGATAGRRRRLPSNLVPSLSKVLRSSTVQVAFDVIAVGAFSAAGPCAIYNR